MLGVSESDRNVTPSAITHSTRSQRQVATLGGSKRSSVSKSTLPVVSFAATTTFMSKAALAPPERRASATTLLVLAAAADFSNTPLACNTLQRPAATASSWAMSLAASSLITMGLSGWTLSSRTRQMCHPVQPITMPRK